MDSHLPSRRRAYWLKTLHQWHWISSAICLLGMLLFAVTGLTLNNASHIESKAVVTTRHATLPQDALRQLAPGRKKRAAARRRVALAGPRTGHVHRRQAGRMVRR